MTVSDGRLGTTCQPLTMVARWHAHRPNLTHGCAGRQRLCVLLQPLQQQTGYVMLVTEPSCLAVNQASYVLE